MNYGTIGNGSLADGNPGFGPRLDSAREDVSALCARIENLADRLVGGVPPSTQAGNPSKLAAVSNGVFPAVEDAATHISERVKWASEQISRIERALP